MPKKTIKDFYRTIKADKLINGKRVTKDHILFDYEKIYDDPAPIYLVISERGSKGKSTQAKRLARKLWKDKKLETMWIMNTLSQLKKEKKSHFKKPHQYLIGKNEPFTGDEYIEGDSAYVKTDTNPKPYTFFSSLTTAENEKSSRDDVAVVIYDEFNVGTRMIKYSQVDLISSLIGTLTDPVNQADSPFKKLIIHGNFKSLNSEVLLALGIVKIDGELTTINDSIGKPLIRILVPKFTKAEKDKLKDELKGNIGYEIQNALGKADHVYFNENLHDELMNIDPFKSSEPHIVKYLITMSNNLFIIKMHKDRSASISLVKRNRIKPNAKVLSIDPRDVSENTIYHKQLKESLKKLLFKGTLYFDSSYTRENLLIKLRK